MNISTKKGRGIVLALVVAVVGMGLSACTTASTATPTAMCGFIVGDGQDGHDSNIHKVIYPGQVVDYNTDTEVARFVPCNSRNYLINDGTTKNANGDIVGDRTTPSLAYTSTGVPVYVWSSAYWTLNEDKKVLTTDFQDLCFKYTCYSTDAKAGDANFATPGWNGMLGENFGTAVNDVAFESMGAINDDIWKKNSPELYKQLSKSMSANFAGAMRAKLGYANDVFCGSGNSGWKNPEKRDVFQCTNVRIKVDRVERVPTTSNGDTSSNAAKELNKLRLDAAKELYGKDAGYWLGLQDTLQKCSTTTSCIINLGGSGSSSVSVPAPATK